LGPFSLAVHIQTDTGMQHNTFLYHFYLCFHILVTFMLQLQGWSLFSPHWACVCIDHPWLVTLWRCPGFFRAGLSICI